MRDLSDLMSAANLDDFIRNFHYKTSWYGHAVSLEQAQALLSWQRLDATLGSGGFPAKRLRVMAKGECVDPSMYTDATGTTLKVGAFQALAEQGATFIVDGISNAVEPLGRLSQGIERELDGNVNCSAYISFGEQSAFPPHYDDHDVLIIHLRGSKAWCGFGQNLPFPIRRGPTQRVGEPVWTRTLRAGDLLYVPRGEVHVTLPVDRPTMHLTIGIREQTGVDFVKSLAEAAEAQELFRRSLLRTGIAEQEQALKQALHALVDAASLEALLAHNDQQRRLRPAASFNFAQRLNADTMLESMLLRRVPLHVDDPRDLKLVLGGNSVRLSQLERRALDHLTRADRVSFARLAEVLGCVSADTVLIDSLSNLAQLALVAIARV